MEMKIGSPARSMQRSPLVDAVRGISILLVMLFHFDMYYHLATCLPVKALHLGHLLTLITRNGYFGVTMFFLISGFLITGTSLQRFGRLQPLSDGLFSRGFFVPSENENLQKIAGKKVLLTYI